MLAIAKKPCEWCSEPLERDWTKYCDACVALMPRAKVSGPAEFSQLYPRLTATPEEHENWRNRVREGERMQRLRRKKRQELDAMVHQG